MNKPDYKCMAIVQWMCVYASEHGGNSPTLQEIADQYKVSVVTAWNHVEKLKEFGLVDRVDGKLVLAGAVYVPPQWYVEKVLD